MSVWIFVITATRIGSHNLKLVLHTQRRSDLNLEILTFSIQSCYIYAIYIHNRDLNEKHLGCKLKSERSTVRQSSVAIKYEPVSLKNTHERAREWLARMALQIAALTNRWLCTKIENDFRFFPRELSKEDPKRRFSVAWKRERERDRALSSVTYNYYKLLCAYTTALRL